MQTTTVTDFAYQVGTQNDENVKIKNGLSFPFVFNDCPKQFDAFRATLFGDFQIPLGFHQNQRTIKLFYVKADGNSEIAHQANSRTSTLSHNNS